MPDNNHAGLLVALEAVMREAGALARDMASKPLRQWTKGADLSPVSEGDIAVNNLLRERLPQLAPGAGWVSEETESSHTAGAQALVWIVDPIDGTRAYITGKIDWTISVALAGNGRPIVAALYAPVTDEMFLARAGLGATRNGAPMRCNDSNRLDGARMAGPKRLLDQIGSRVPAMQPQPRVHSLALRLTRVAEGALDASLSSGGSRDWDLAAADLLVHEAGGVLTDFGGQSLRYNRPDTGHSALIAAGPARHNALIELMRDRPPEIA